MDFLISNDFVALRIENDGFVFARFGVAVDEPPYHKDAKFAGKRAKKFSSHAALFVADFRHLHREAGVEHLGQKQQ